MPGADDPGSEKALLGRYDPVMIRVIYRWYVPPDRHDEFLRWWHDGTLRIRSEHPGAMGSTLCDPTSSGDRVVAIARWRSREALEQFWQHPGGSGVEGVDMESVEILEELDHLTREE